MSPRSIAGAALFVLGGGSTLLAQQSGGPLIGIPMTLSVDGAAAGGLNPAATLLKPNGFMAAAIAPWPAGPNSLDLPTILASAQCGGAGIDIDDISLGEDLLLVDDNLGRIAVPNNQWAGITFSVGNATMGIAGSRVAQEAQAGLPGAAVFSYLFPGSGLPGGVVGRVERVHSRRELGIVSLNSDVDALDNLAPMRRLEPQLQSQYLSPIEIYFTVSAASIPQVPTIWWGGTPPSGASVLVVRRSVTGGWMCPTVWRTFAAIGVPQNTDIDALAIDLMHSRMVFSTTTNTPDPLMFHYFGVDLPLPPVPLLDPDNTPVSTKIGVLQVDDVDAVCALDPLVRGGVGGSNASYFCFPTVRPTHFVTPAPLSAGAQRGFVNGLPVMDTWLIGWPTAAPAPGTAALYLTFGDNVNPVFNLLWGVPRNPLNPIPGDPVHAQLPIPVTVTLFDVVVTLRWFAIDGGSNAFREAWPLRVHV